MGVIFNNALGQAVSVVTEGSVSSNVRLSVQTKSGGDKGTTTPFGEAIGGNSAYGFATSISGSFSEAISRDGTSLNASANMKFGTFTLKGVAFARTCNPVGDPDTAGRHGIEGLLNFWEKNRPSSTDNSTRVLMTIGRTVLSGALYDFSFSPLSSNFNMLSWQISMLVSPNYKPQPL